MKYEGEGGRDLIQQSKRLTAGCQAGDEKLNNICKKRAEEN
jgi:hypothetical protein